MSRSGPEDNLVAMETGFNSSTLRTAGNDWVIARTSTLRADQLDYKDVEEQRRFTAQVVSEGAAGTILRDLMTQRYNCSKQMYMNEVRCAGVVVVVVVIVTRLAPGVGEAQQSSERGGTHTRN